jgi:8-oxo-dGTP diphosphatase
VVWRFHESTLQVILVHRPRYDDWSLPKGKLEAGEHPLLAAVREVAEETGSTAVAGRRLNAVCYPTSAGDKRVTYWAMRYLRGEHEPSREVDAISWFSVDEAMQRLTYPVERAVLEEFARLPPDLATVVLLRHAKAGRRSEFRGDDRLRPLDKIGRKQARDAAPVLAAFGPNELLAADRTRCEQTLAPLSSLLELTVRSAPAMSACLDDPATAVAEIRRLARAWNTLVICSQGKAIPAILELMRAPASSFPTRKGSAWALSLDRDKVVAANYYARPTT